MEHEYRIDGRSFPVSIDEASFLQWGAPEILSERFRGLADPMAWRESGYAVLAAKGFYDIDKVYAATSEAVRRIILEIKGEADLSAFRLERYHDFVTGPEHAQIIARTRRLFPADLGFDVGAVVEAFGQYLGTRLGFRNPVTGAEQWMIARINRPGSQDYNPVHKDIYESYDRFGRIARMINVWIPVCGVQGGSGLPVAPGSHRIPEDRVLRTRTGGMMNGLQYSVNCIAEWDGLRELETINPGREEFLIFSSHLIHGLARNANRDETRVSFEFRLYEQD
ncbi:MAG: hypothetical protein ACKOEY_14660 [Phenylobacterium sp.]